MNIKLPNILSVSKLTLKMIKSLKPDTSVRVQTEGGNLFDVYKDFSVGSVQNGSVYKADTLTEAKFFIHCYK